MASPLMPDGDFVHERTIALTPKLLRRALDTKAAPRVEALTTLADACAGGSVERALAAGWNSTFASAPVVKKVRALVKKQLAALLEQLGAADVATRRAAALLASTWPEAAPALADRLDLETEPVVRALVILARSPFATATARPRGGGPLVDFAAGLAAKAPLVSLVGSLTDDRLVGTLTPRTLFAHRARAAGDAVALFAINEPDAAIDTVLASLPARPAVRGPLESAELSAAVREALLALPAFGARFDPKLSARAGVLSLRHLQSLAGSAGPADRRTPQGPLWRRAFAVIFEDAPVAAFCKLVKRAQAVDVVRDLASFGFTLGWPVNGHASDRERQRLAERFGGLVRACLKGVPANALEKAVREELTAPGVRQHRAALFAAWVDAGGVVPPTMDAALPSLVGRDDHQSARRVFESVPAPRRNAAARSMRLEQSDLADGLWLGKLWAVADLCVSNETRAAVREKLVDGFKQVTVDRRFREDVAPHLRRVVEALDLRGELAAARTPARQAFFDAVLG